MKTIYGRRFGDAGGGHVQPEPVDLSHHLSRTTRNRNASSIKRFYKYFAIPGIGQLAGGEFIFFFFNFYYLLFGVVVVWSAWISVGFGLLTFLPGWVEKVCRMLSIFRLIRWRQRLRCRRGGHRRIMRCKVVEEKKAGRMGMVRSWWIDGRRSMGI